MGSYLKALKDSGLLDRLESAALDEVIRFALDVANLPVPVGQDVGAGEADDDEALLDGITPFPEAAA